MTEPSISAVEPDPHEPKCFRMSILVGEDDWYPVALRQWPDGEVTVTIAGVPGWMDCADMREAEARVRAWAQRKAEEANDD